MDRQRPQTDTMVGGGAPQAGRPGRGTGNIPFAGGMATGNFSPQGRPPQAAAPPPASRPPASPSPQAPQQEPPQGGGGGGAVGPPPLGPGQQNPYLDPRFYFDVQAALMAALMNAAESDTFPY